MPSPTPQQALPPRRISRRLRLAFAILAATTAIATAAALSAFQAVEDALETQTQSYKPAQQAAANMLYASYQLAALLELLPHATSASEVDTLSRQIEAIQHPLPGLAQRLTTQTRHPDSLLANQLASSRAQVHELVRLTSEALRAPTPQLVTDQTATRVSALRRSLWQQTQTVRQLSRTLEGQQQNAIQQLSAQLQQNRIVLLLMLFVSLLLSLALGYLYVGHHIAGRLSGLAGNMRRLAAGDTDITTDDAHDDEITDMSASLTIFRDAILQLHSQSDALRVAKDTSEAATRAKSEFLANMSHEIRTPLTAVLGYTHLLQSTALHPAQQAQLDKIDIAARSLLAVINDILDFSKIEAGKLSLEHHPFTLATLLAQLRDTVQMHAEQKKLRLIIDTSPGLPSAFVGDALRIGQILLNLTNNAIKFTEHGLVRIAISGTPLRDGLYQLQCRVSDTGIGMQPEQVDKLFQPFSQADTSTTRRFGGTGLGLVICRQLVSLMSGTLQVKSIPGEGSVFTCELPLAISDVAEAPMTASPLPPLATTGSLQGMHLLLAEDNELLQEFESQLLTSLGARITIAHNGLQAVELALHQPFDAILMDIQMPEMDGLSATQAIRRRFSQDELPIIAMTAHALESEQQRSLDHGMNDHLTKPIQPEKLVATLRRWVAPRQAADARPQAPAALQLPDMPAFDLAQASAQLGGKTALLLRLLRRMQQDYAQTAHQIQQLIEQGHHTEARRQAHSLKGVAATLYALQLQKAAAAIETALTENDPQRAAALLPGLHLAMAEVRENLERLPEISPSSPPTTDTRSTLPVDRMKELNTLLAERNIRARKLFDQLQPSLQQRDATRCQQLALAITSLDYTSARLQLSLWLSQINQETLDRVAPQYPDR